MLVSWGIKRYLWLAVALLGKCMERMNGLSSRFSGGFYFFIVVVCLLFVNLSPAYAKDRVIVFAAASLKGALDELVGLYSGDVAVSYGGSGLIARQVASGAPADLLILANDEWMDWLAQELGDKLVKQDSFLGNRLVLVSPKQFPQRLEISERGILEGLDGGRLAVGMTTSVPAGIYARQWLESVGYWQGLKDHLAETDNVRAALALVARGEVRLGIVYASDALAEGKVQVVYQIPLEAHDVIRYPLAVLGGRNVEAASDLANFLGSDKGIAVFRKHGFLSQRGQE